MKSADSKRGKRAGQGSSTSELLLLPDGRVLAHNLTPRLARILAGLRRASSARACHRQRGKFTVIGGESALNTAS